MSIVGALAARVLRNKRKHREELDIWRLYHFIFYSKQLSELSEGVKPADLKYPDQRVSYSKQYSVVHSAVTQQVISLLSPDAAAVSGLDPPPSSSDTTTNSQTGSNFTTSPLCPHQLVVPGPPSAENPIPGVELRGEVWPGTVLCFYPGTLYFPSHQREMPNYPDISLANPYLMSRTDDIIIDAHSFGMEEIRSNPLAVGHMIRHPPEGMDPNIMPFSYDVDPRLSGSKQLLSLIPNRYHKEPRWLYSKNKVPIRTIVFVSMRTIRNEELFLNFRLHPQSQMPSWYTPVDDKENERRWNL